MHSEAHRGTPRHSAALRGTPRQSYLEEETDLGLCEVLHLVHIDLVQPRSAIALGPERRVDGEACIHHVIRSNRFLPSLVLEVQVVHEITPHAG